MKWILLEKHGGGPVVEGSLKGAMNFLCVKAHVVCK